MASALRRWWTIARNPQATIRFGKGCYLGPGFRLVMPQGGEFIAGHGVEFRRNFHCEVGAGGRVTIGDRSFITYDVVIACSTTIEIGERVGIGNKTCVYDGSHRYRDPDRPLLHQGYDFRPLKIDDDAAIHSLCTVVNSVGRKAVIGANAVVTKPVPAYTVAAGVPARLIDYFGPEGEEPEELRNRAAQA
jgi:acetyltransferase-like isoleucine patch superfamily enzyme